MEQAAVDHAGEPLAPVPERRRVLDQELHRRPRSAAFRPADRLLHKVDAGDLVAPGGEEQGVVARAAAGVEDRAGDRSATATNGPCGLPMSQGAGPA